MGRPLKLCGSGTLGGAGSVVVTAEGDGNPRRVAVITVTGLLSTTDDYEMQVDTIKVGGKDLMIGNVAIPWAALRTQRAGRGFDLLALVGYELKRLPLLGAKGSVQVRVTSSVADTFVLTVDTLPEVDSD